MENLLLEKTVSILTILFGIFLYVIGFVFGINDLWWHTATGAELITGLLLLDGVSRGWLL